MSIRRYQRGVYSGLRTSAGEGHVPCISACKHGHASGMAGTAQDGCDLDCLIIDLPPGTGDEPLSVAQLIPEIDGAIVVTTPQDVALLDSRKVVTFAKKLGMPVIGIIENMSGFKCPKCGEVIDLFKTGGGERAATDMGVPFLGRIPIEDNIVEAGDSGSPFVLAHESEAASAFEAIVDGIEHIVKGE